jgi:FMN-dependent NADH-azoreductase
MEAMKKLLQINASMFSSNGQSSRLADRFVTALRERNADFELRVRDLASEPVPHLDADRFQAFLASAEARTPEQTAVVKFSEFPRR